MRKTASATPKWIKNNTEVEEFYNDSEYTNVIYNACWKNGLDRSRWDEVRNTVAIKFGQGKLKYDPTRGATLTTFIFTVAENAALSLLRSQHSDLFQDKDEAFLEKIGKEYKSCRMTEKEDDLLLVREALRRLHEKTGNKRNLEILLRYVVNGEKREVLAREYGVTADQVSLVKHRLLPQFQHYLEEVIKEDEQGRLRIGNISKINFLIRFLK